MISLYSITFLSNSNNHGEGLMQESYYMSTFYMVHIMFSCIVLISFFVAVLNTLFMNLNDKGLFLLKCY